MKKVNYSHVFGTFTPTTLALINATKYVHSDSNGKYVWTATGYDNEGNVTFVKEYK